MQVSNRAIGNPESLDDRTLLVLSRYWGRAGQVATRRFLATLPEIDRRSLYRRARCHSLHEYAARYAGASREIVDTVLLVHRRIGRFEVLWRLFADGRAGLHVFRRISRHVTAENAAWWAEIVQTCTIREIERILAAKETSESSWSGGQLALAAGAPGARVPVGAEPPGTPGPAPAGEAVEERFARPAPAGVPPDRAANGGQVAGPIAAAGRVEGAASGDADLSRVAGGWRLSPLAEQIAANFVAAYRRRGLTVSVRDVVEAALRHVAIAGILPDIPGARRAVCSRPSVSPVAAADAAGAPFESAGEEPYGARGDKFGPAGSSHGTGHSAGSAAPRPPRVRLPRVIISVSEIGMSFLRALGGLIPISPAEALDLESPMPPVAYADLVAKAEAEGRASTGRLPPGSVKLAVWVRAGGSCEARGCRAPIDEFEHRDPYSEVRRHLPGRIAGLCWECHRALHDGLIENPHDPPGQWRRIREGDARTCRAVDRKVQACRTRARHGHEAGGQSDGISGSRTDGSVASM
ncbi:MAG: hypothetical protein FJZ01_01145 [Candidatus Sericytochromatia bacterium]|nr:hypothetical protein [Candidatus Tanganyikabacteria bacterium]